MMDELLEEMIDPAPSRQDVARRRRGWATGSILVLAAVGVTSLTTSALFTDQDTVTGGISTGSIVLDSDESVTFAMPVGGLAPGDAVVAEMPLRNVGSLELRYAVSLSAATAPAPDPAVDAGEGNLPDQLRVRLYDVATCSVAATESAAHLGDTADLVGGGFGVPGTLQPIVGDPATGPDVGDRALAGATGSETLCVRVDMSIDAGDDYQNTAAGLTFQIDSEQTVNNP